MDGQMLDCREGNSRSLSNVGAIRNWEMVSSFFSSIWLMAEIKNSGISRTSSVVPPWLPSLLSLGLLFRKLQVPVKLQ